MVYCTVFLREDQDLFLRKLPGSKAGHIRRAIDDYIQKMKGINAGTSASKGKEENG